MSSILWVLGAVIGCSVVCQASETKKEYKVLIELDIEGHSEEQIKHKIKSNLKHISKYLKIKQIKLKNVKKC